LADGQAKRESAFISKSSIEQNGTNRRSPEVAGPLRAPSETQAGGRQKNCVVNGMFLLSVAQFVEQSASARKTPCECRSMRSSGNPALHKARFCILLSRRLGSRGVGLESGGARSNSKSAARLMRCSGCLPRTRLLGAGYGVLALVTILLERRMWL